MNNLIRVSSLIIIILSAFNFAALPQPVNPKVDAIFTEYNSALSPGCALGVVKDGKLIYSKGYGMADLEHDIPITASSVFYIASVSKQFVTMAVLLLEEQGKLGLDDEIQKYLPDFPRYESPLTIRHFIHHTSGVRDYLTLWSLAGNDYLDRVDKNAVYQLIKRQQTLNFTPGERYLYSNSCYFMLAMIVEKASGDSIQEFARKNIFNPLQMNESHFHDNNLHIIKNRAFSYSPADDNSPNDDFDNLIMRFDLVGSGGVYSTITDLYKWDQNFYHNILGKGGPEIINKMHEDGVLNNGESAKYAYALQNDTYRGLKTVSHGGSLAGYRTQLLRFPGQNFSVILLGNISSFSSGKMAREIADVYLADELMPIKVAATKASSKSQKEENEYSVANLSQFTGTYYSKELDVAYKLSEEDGRLFVSVKDNDPLVLKSTKIDTFSYEYIELVFDRNAKNAISGFIINAGRVQNLVFVKDR
jgi:CubicO group peptidase (beta-lactamase class C family)